MSIQHSFKPRLYQDLIINHEIDILRCNIWAGMGMGKTVATLTTLEDLFMSGVETQPALVLAPLRVAASTWPDEAVKWGQAWFVDQGQRLGRTYGAFTSRWFNSIQFPGQSWTKLEPFAHSQGEIQRALADVTISLDAADWFDIAEPIHNVIRVDMPPKARQQYREMEKEMFLELNGEGIEAPNAAAKTVKCLQIASGAVYTDDAGSWAELHDAKLQALDNILTEAAGAPVLVAYHWKHDLERLLKALPRGRHLDQDPQTLRDWNAGKIPVLFAHPASAGHGLNMQDGGNILVFFSHWWDLEQYQQIIERIGPTRQIQAGHNRPVFIHHIITADTMDEMIMERRNSKRTVQDILLDAMKKRGL